MSRRPDAADRGRPDPADRGSPDPAADRGRPDPADRGSPDPAADRGCPDPAADRGVSSVEVVVFTPLLVGFMLFIVALGMVVEVRGEVYGAARDAAREATRQRDPVTAMAVAQEVAEADLGDRCDGIADRRPRAEHVGGEFRAGGVVTIEVSCTVDLAGLNWVGLGTRKTVVGRSTAPIDERRRFEE